LLRLEVDAVLSLLSMPLLQRTVAQDADERSVCFDFSGSLLGLCSSGLLCWKGALAHLETLQASTTTTTNAALSSKTPSMLFRGFITTSPMPKRTFPPNCCADPTKAAPRRSFEPLSLLALFQQRRAQSKSSSTVDVHITSRAKDGMRKLREFYVAR